MHISELVQPVTEAAPVAGRQARGCSHNLVSENLAAALAEWEVGIPVIRDRAPSPTRPLAASGAEK